MIGLSKFFAANFLTTPLERDKLMRIENDLEMKLALGVSIRLACQPIMTCPKFDFLTRNALFSRKPHQSTSDYKHAERRDLLPSYRNIHTGSFQQPVERVSSQ